jgi:YD repeat-containing protein
MKKITIITVLLLNALFAISQVTYQYDNLNRLSQVAYQSGTTTEYTYDELGNRQTKTVVGSSSPEFVVDANGVLIGYNGSGGDVMIPDNLGITAIGKFVFWNNSSLTAVFIPDGVTSIADSAFLNCGQLREATIPAGMLSIGNSAFQNTGLDSLVIPHSVTGIGDLAFAYCTNIESVYVSWSSPLSITTAYPSGAVFSGLTLSGIKLVVPAGTGAAYAAADVWKEFNIREGDSSPANSDFVVVNGVLVGYNGSGGDVVIPDNLGITAIGNAFQGKNNITSVVVPDGVDNIRANAFDGSFLETISIPASVTSIGDGAFYKCSRLTSVTVDAGNTTYSSANGVLYNKNQTVLIYYPAGKTDPAFAIPGTVTQIYKNAFSFSQSGLSVVTIPGSVTSIGESAFSYCFDLSSVHVSWNTPVSINANVFSSLTLSGLTLHVPAGTKALYEAANVWKEFGTIVEASATATLSVTPSSLSFAVNGGSQTFVISSNVTWSVSSSASWTTLSAASGSSNGAVTVTVNAYSGSSSRTATITVSGAGVGNRTVTVSQEATAVTAPSTVLPASISLNSAEMKLKPGGTGQLSATVLPTSATDKSVTWSSSNQQVATVSATGRVTAVSSGSAVITARTVSGGLTAACAVTVEEQSLVAQPTPPADSRGSIEVSLNIPVSELFTVSFTLTLPAGFNLDQAATALVSELQGSHRLTITAAGTGSWLFEIRPNTSLRSAGETMYQQVVHIVYTLETSVADGDYEVKVNDVNLALASGGTVIHQDEIKVPVQVGNATGNEGVNTTEILYYNGLLTVNTPSAERIGVYSVSGSLLYQAQKPAGEATFNLGHLPKGVYIVKGSSGWVRKIVR